jgi:hypothetical protein
LKAGNNILVKENCRSFYFFIVFLFFFCENQRKTIKKLL